MNWPKISTNLLLMGLKMAANPSYTISITIDCIPTTDNTVIMRVNYIVNVLHNYYYIIQCSYSYNNCN